MICTRPRIINQKTIGLFQSPGRRQCRRGNPAWLPRWGARPTRATTQGCPYDSDFETALENQGKTCNLHCWVVYFPGNLLLRKVGLDLTTPRRYVIKARIATLMLLGLVTALFGPFGRGVVLPSASAAPLGSVPATSVTIPAGG